MHIVDTFVKNLYSFKYEGEGMNELERLLDLWNDVVYLTDFFDEQEEYLEYFGYESARAVTKTIDDARDLDELLINLESRSDYSLEQFFRPLDDREYRPVSLSRQKAKQRQSWLRLYAIKIDVERFVITGGAIKLTHKMEEADHTKNELVKLERCRAYLRSKGVFDDHSFYDLFNELN